MDLSNYDVMCEASQCVDVTGIRKRKEKKHEKIKEGDGFCPSIVHDL